MVGSALKFRANTTLTELILRKLFSNGEDGVGITMSARRPFLYISVLASADLESIASTTTASLVLGKVAPKESSKISSPSRALAERIVAMAILRILRLSFLE